MAVITRQLDVHQRRAASLPSAFDRLAGGVVDREEIESVDFDSRHAKPGGSAQLTASDRPRACGRLGVAIVFDHEDDWQLPDLRQIVRFERCALIGAAVSDERHRDAAGLEVLGGQGRATNQRRPSAHDPVRPQHPLCDIRDVHRSALAATQTIAPSIYFLHHRHDVTPLCDAMAVAAVRRGYHVADAELRADADGGRLLSGVEMDEARNLAAGEFVVDAILEATDRGHAAIAVEEKLPTVLHVASQRTRSMRVKLRVTAVAARARLRQNSDQTARWVSRICGAGSRVASATGPLPLKPSPLCQPAGSRSNPNSRASQRVVEFGEKGVKARAGRRVEHRFLPVISSDVSRAGSRLAGKLREFRLVCKPKTSVSADRARRWIQSASEMIG